MDVVILAARRRMDRRVLRNAEGGYDPGRKAADRKESIEKCRRML